MRVDDACQVLASGGGLRIGIYPADDLVRMASNARNGGGQLTIVAIMPTAQMAQIAAAGKGHVTFDIISKDK